MTQQEFLNRYHYNPETDKLGAGGFGSVFKAYDTVYDREVAIKIAPVISGKENLSLMKEVELANKLPAHPNIVNYESCFRITGMEGSKDIGILQYYPEGSLATIIKKGNLNEEQKADLIKGILDGLEFLHEHNIMHRDLKPGNILIAKRENQYIPKIADFGLSRQVESFEKSSFVNSFAGGSAYYAAPEQLAGEKVRANVDLWSFGVILYELMTGDRPFTATTARSETEDARQEIYGKIKRGDIPTKINTIAEPYQTMIKACLIPDRKKRAQNVGELMAIMEGNTPAHLDLDKTSIEDVVTTPVEKKPPISNTTKATFTTSSTTRVKDKQQKSTKAPTKSSRKKNKTVFPLFLFGGIAIVAAIVGYIVWGGADSDRLSEQELWIAALEQKDEASYQAVVDAYPQGKYTNRAQAVVDSLQAITQAAIKAEADAWAQAQRTNSIESYQSYLNTYPEGLHVIETKGIIKELKAAQSEEEAEARKKAEEAEDAAWARCKRKNEIVVYQAFINDYPDGRYVSEAREAIQDLRKKQERQKKKESGTFTDSRDGQTYTWKRMKDGKKWMTQNLNYKTSNSYCYDDKNSNCRQYGRLYTWTATKSACPSGWRLPSDTEWRNMAKKYGGASNERDDGLIGYDEAVYKALIPGGNSGFSVQFGGYLSTSHSFDGLGIFCSFWSSSDQDTRHNHLAWTHSFNSKFDQFYRDSASKIAGYFCRCIQD